MKRREQLERFEMDGELLDLSSACQVIGGVNGAGKSRLLKAVAATLGSAGLYLDLHHLSEQAMILLRSRDDLAEMAEDEGFSSIHGEVMSDLTKIIGAEYESVEWAQLELIPAEASVADTFKWRGDRPLVPYFRVRHHGLDYSGQEMGAGEFSTHLLFWILRQFAEQPGLTLLLDEPDAFLPPIGVQSLLRRLIRFCAERDWQLIISTHAEEMIRESALNGAFSVIYSDEEGHVRGLPITEDSDAILPLLADPHVESVIFCEDESAYYLIRAILKRHAGGWKNARTQVAWGNGDGFLRDLWKSLPKPPRFPISFTLLLDGDQWDKVESRSSGWPLRFLPTKSDPDELFKQSVSAVSLAGALGEDVRTVRAFLSSIAGQEKHDWVNRLGARFGREAVLRSLADHWVELNGQSAAEAAVQWFSAESFLLHPSQGLSEDSKHTSDEKAFKE